MREIGSVREGGNEGAKNVPNIDVDEMGSMHDLRSYGSNGSLHGRERSSDPAKESRRDGAQRENYEKCQRTGRLVHDRVGDWPLLQFLSRGSITKVIIVEGGLDVCNCGGAGSWHKGCA